MIRTRPFFARRTTILALLFALALPLAAHAKSTVPDRSGLAPTFETICDGDCSQNPILEARRMETDLKFDFALGLKALLDGSDLSVTTDGSIFLFASIFPSGDVTVNANDSIQINPGSLSGFDGMLPDISDFPDFIDLPDLILAPNFVELVSGEVVGHSICACVRIADPVGDLILIDQSTSILNAVVGVEGLEPPTAAGFQLSGDIYLDISMIDVSRLELTAGRSIVILTADSIPVPEPGTAMLLGLGLLGLGHFRRRI